MHVDKANGLKNSIPQHSEKNYVANLSYFQKKKKGNF